MLTSQDEYKPPCGKQVVLVVRLCGWMADEVVTMIAGAVKLIIVMRRRNLDWLNDSIGLANILYMVRAPEYDE